MNQRLKKYLKAAFWYLMFDGLILGYVGLVPGVQVAAAQTLLTTTTLSAAVPNTLQSVTTAGLMGVVTVASATGITAPAGNTSGVLNNVTGTFLFVDRELMDVRGISGTTVTVVRGAEGTSATSHASGALVFVVPAQLSTYVGSGGGPLSVPAGSCTRGNEIVLPRIQYATGVISDCLGGQWINGDSVQTQRQTFNGFRYPDPGGTALTALETAGTAASANTEIYCTEVDLPYSQLLTGIAVLNGTTVGTNKHFAILYDSSGNVLANSAVAGVTTANASTYQKLNFVTKYYAVGPARYFACDGLNGTTDTIRHAITAVNDNVLGGAVTGQVFGTAAAVTLPATFTTAKAPYFMLF
jgi:hypothetical protein